MSRLVLLDLEQTVIDSWENRVFLMHNLEAIKSSGILTPDTTVGLMSWAIWDYNDSRIVIDELIPPLEEVLDIQIDRSLPMSMEEYAADILSYRKLRLSAEDMFDMFKKEEVLLSLARFCPKFSDLEIILIDDVADHNLTFNVPSTKATVRFINIKQSSNTWLFNVTYSF